VQLIAMMQYQKLNYCIIAILIHFHILPGFTVSYCNILINKEILNTSEKKTRWHDYCIIMRVR
jgi:hypothetical protein